MKTPANQAPRVRPLWQWIGVRMIGLALVAMALVGAGMWLRFFWWEGQLRGALPAAMQALMADFNQMAARLQRQERELQASSAAIAHELRTPLTAAKGRLQGLMDGVFDASPQQLGTIMRQLDQLNRLIDDVYVLSLATAGQPLLPLVPSTFAVRALLEGLAPPIQVRIACAENLRLYADRDRIGQVLSIVIDNAVRYAAAGGELVLSARRQKDTVTLTVEDAGPGFAPEHIERVCERFWRAEDSRSRHAIF